jgi:hypothetical protein
MAGFARLTVARILIEQCLELYGPNQILGPAQTTVQELLVARVIAMLK